MKIELVQLEDLNGTHWRLALDEAAGVETIVVLECLYSNVITDWVRLKDLTSDPSEVGVEWRKPGVMMLDKKRAFVVLEKFMAEHGSTRRPADIIEGLHVMTTLNGLDAPSVEEPTLEGHRRVSLLEYLVAVESAASLATRGLWLPAGVGSMATVLDAVVTNAPTDPVAESLFPEDMAHILATQPLSASALVRKLREAFYLLQDLAKAAAACRGELDNLSAPAHRPEQFAAHIDMFDRWMKALGERCAAFPTIQVPDFTPGRGPRVADKPEFTTLDRVQLVRIAKNEAFRAGYRGEHDYLPKHADEAQSFDIHEWVLWAMAAAVEYAKRQAATP